MRGKPKYSVMFVSMTGALFFFSVAVFSAPQKDGSTYSSQTLQTIQEFQEHVPTNNPEAEAAWTANQYESMSQAIKVDRESGAIPSSSIYQISIMGHIKNILNIINEQTNKLVELIRPGKTQTLETSAEVSTILNTLDQQRQGLSTFIASPEVQNSRVKFDPAKFDRPKDKKFNVYSP